MKPDQEALIELLNTNPAIVAAWFEPNIAPECIQIRVNSSNLRTTIALPEALQGMPIKLATSEPFKILITKSIRLTPQNANQACQDEPIKLGTQLQPEGAQWFGTAGSQCRWPDANGNDVFGILSNWHVMASGDERRGRGQHQPDTLHAQMAKLYDWSPIDRNGPNQIDAAIADALIDGYHTISTEIIGLGPIGPKPINATVGLNVVKSGRTTGITRAKCEAVGAAIKVGYGDFTATFVDQDIFSSFPAEFSAPGDSGSMILGDACHCPCSLLFAGNSILTVGNPIRFINDAFNLKYPFPTNGV